MFYRTVPLSLLLYISLTLCSPWISRADSSDSSTVTLMSEDAVVGPGECGPHTGDIDRDCENATPEAKNERIQEFKKAFEERIRFLQSFQKAIEKTIACMMKNRPGDNITTSNENPIDATPETTPESTPPQVVGEERQWTPARHPLKADDLIQSRQAKVELKSKTSPQIPSQPMSLPLGLEDQRTAMPYSKPSIENCMLLLSPRSNAENDAPESMALPEILPTLLPLHQPEVQRAFMPYSHPSMADYHHSSNQNNNNDARISKTLPPMPMIKEEQQRSTLPMPSGRESIGDFLLPSVRPETEERAFQKYPFRYLLPFSYGRPFAANQLLTLPHIWQRPLGWPRSAQEQPEPDCVSNQLSDLGYDEQHQRSIYELQQDPTLLYNIDNIATGNMRERSILRK